MKKQYYEKEIECKFCHKKSKPILEKNTTSYGAGFMAYGSIGRIGASGDKKYQLVCPNCKAIIDYK